MFKLTGTVKLIKDTEQVTEKFSKREFVINDASSMYPQDIIFQAAQDKCSMLDDIAEGETVDVSFDIRGREWVSPQGEVKYFNTLNCWRIEKVGASQEQPTPLPQDMQNDPIGGEQEDLPF